MSATMKIHLKTRRRPKSSVIDRVPYVGMGEPLTARSPNSCLCFRSAAVGGMTLTSAPVSTRKRRPVFLSEIYNRRLGKWPVTLVAESEWPSRFPPTFRGLALVGLISKLLVVVANAILFSLRGGSSSLVVESSWAP